MNTYIKILHILLLTSMPLLLACSDQSADKKQEYGETNRITAEEHNPMQQVLQILDLDESDLVSPRYQEDDYHLAARLPLIDHVLSSPFYLHYWADVTSSKLQAAASEGLFDVLALMTATLNGGTSYYDPHNIINSDIERFADAY